jgi:DNA-nicking Smr family endonuclease
MAVRRPDGKQRGAEPPRSDDDDSELFRRLVADAKPLETDTVPPPPRRSSPRARFTRRDRQDVLRESVECTPGESDRSGEELRYQHPSVSRITMRRLARGGFSIQSEIDLHGLTSSEAKAELRQFLADSVMRGHTCVRIVHGKGRGSGAAGPVLKRMVDQWLRRWDAVLAFVTARPADGGSGAIYVLLRRGG